MPDWAVMTRFKATDEVTATYKRMGKAADQFGRQSSSAFRNATKHGYKFGTIVKGILAANAIRGGLGYITEGVRSATTGFLDFDDTMVAAFARFDDLGPKAKNAARGIQTLKERTMDAMRGTEHSIVEAGKAMDFFAKANWKSEAALVALRPMLDIATAAGEEFGATSNMVNDLLGAFGMRAEDSAKQIEHLARMSDVLTRAGLDANGGLVDFFETMKTIGPIAKMVGASLEDVSAMQVLLANSGIKGDRAATGLKHALLNIPGKRMAQEFEDNKVKIEDMNGNIRDYFDILTDIRNKTQNLGNRRQATIFENIFGLYGIAAGANILSKLDETVKARDRLLGAKGVTEEISEFRRNYSLQIKLVILQNAMLEKSFAVFEKFKYQGKQGVEALAAAIQKWDPSRLIDGLKATVWGLQKLWAVAQPFLPMLPYLIAGFLAFNVALKALQIGQAAMLYFRLFTAMKAAIGVTATLNLLMAANPIGLIATGIALAVVGLIFLEKKFKLFSEAWDYWSSATKTFITWISGTTFWKVVSGIGSGLAGFGSALFNMKIPGAEQFAGGRPEPERPAPNAKEAQARYATWQGQLNIAGAPAGSTFEQKSTGAPPLNYVMMGAQ